MTDCLRSPVDHRHTPGFIVASTTVHLVRTAEMTLPCSRFEGASVSTGDVRPLSSALSSTGQSGGAGYGESGSAWARDCWDSSPDGRARSTLPLVEQSLDEDSTCSADVSRRWRLPTASASGSAPRSL